ncbi:MAG: malonyl-ACP O-methyltransferase BioC [Porphyromonas sp.]|nr:malonyl-ACP O-methyltransferase BioC [Porphyromonas sp.]
MASSASIALIADRFRRALPTYEEQAVAQSKIAHHLVGLLGGVCPKGNVFDHVLEIGCGSGILTKALLNEYTFVHYTLNDLYPEAFEYLQAQVDERQFDFICQDAEKIPFAPNKYDLVASSSTVQWLKDLPSFFAKLYETMRVNGYLLLSSFAPDNLYELSSLTKQGLTYYTTEELKLFLSPFFHLVSVEEEDLTLQFDSPLSVLRHIKNTGVTATQETSFSSNYWTPRLLAKFVQEYNLRYPFVSSEGRSGVRLTYKPIYIVAQRKS